MVNQVQIGQPAPNFLAIGVYKQKLGKIRLSDYRGKKYVILIFYPANFTPVSPTELISLNNRIKEFYKLSAQVLAISIDSPFSHLHYLSLSNNKGGLKNLNYPLISDITKTITTDYKLLTNDGLALPGLFIIDKEGLIQYYNVNNLLCGRSINEILRILKSIQYIKENPGEACPADWNTEEYIFPVSSKTLKIKNLF
jgi:peroxiredoxin (alkyl hydroperoxide reductase subunit C)